MFPLGAARRNCAAEQRARVALKIRRHDRPKISMGSGKQSNTGFSLRPARLAHTHQFLYTAAVTPPPLLFSRARIQTAMIAGAMLPNSLTATPEGPRRRVEGSRAVSESVLAALQASRESQPRSARSAPYKVSRAEELRRLAIVVVARSTRSPAATKSHFALILCRDSKALREY